MTVLLDSSKCLSDCSHPQRRIICRAVVIRSADIFISLAKGGHNGNSGEHFSEMSGEVASKVWAMRPARRKLFAG